MRVRGPGANREVVCRTKPERWARVIGSFGIPLKSTPYEVAPCTVYDSGFRTLWEQIYQNECMWPVLPRMMGSIPADTITRPCARPWTAWSPMAAVLSVPWTLGSHGHSMIENLSISWRRCRTCPGGRRRKPRSDPHDAKCGAIFLKKNRPPTGRANDAVTGRQATRGSPLILSRTAPASLKIYPKLDSKTQSINAETFNK